MESFLTQIGDLSDYKQSPLVIATAFSPLFLSAYRLSLAFLSYQSDHGTLGVERHLKGVSLLAQSGELVEGCITVASGMRIHHCSHTVEAALCSLQLHIETGYFRLCEFSDAF